MDRTALFECMNWIFALIPLIPSPSPLAKPCSQPASARSSHPLCRLQRQPCRALQSRVGGVTWPFRLPSGAWRGGRRTHAHAHRSPCDGDRCCCWPHRPHPWNRSTESYSQRCPHTSVELRPIPAHRDSHAPTLWTRLGAPISAW